MVEGVVAIAGVVALQFLGAWSGSRWRPVQRLVKARPSILLREGTLLHERLRRERVTEEEVLAAVRASGHGDTSEIGVVVLETDGTLSVVPRRWMGEGSALAGLPDRGG